MFNSPELCLEDLERNYTNIGHPIAYSGINTIYSFYNGILKKKEIEKFLSTNFAYTLHKETTKQKVNPTFKYFR